MPGNDNYTKLLLHMDDVGLTDSSSIGHTITKNGDVARSSSQYKFGGYSAYFDGTEDYLSINSHTDLNFGTGDFTVDFWLYTGTTGQNVLGKSFSPGWYFWTGYSGEIHFYGNNNTSVVAGASNLSNDQWHHIAGVRSGTTMYLFVNGVLVDSETYSVNEDNSNPLIIGGYTTGGQKYTGYLEEVRISKGIARWTSNFTPPTFSYRERKVVGDVNDSATLIVVDESTWSVINAAEISTGSYEIDTASGTQLIIARRGSDGEVLAYGGIVPIT
jgi:hypothetical protein